VRVHHLFTDRHGGASPRPYRSLNLAYHTGDQPAIVTYNRQRLCKRHKIPPTVWMDQVHGDRIVTVDTPSPDTIPACDGIVTDRPGLALAVMVADCIPILIADERRGVIAAVHAGRNGTMLGIAAKAITTMGERFGSDPDGMRAWLGPSIHACCYEVSPLLARLATERFGPAYVNGRYLDLPAINRDTLQRLGVPSDRIHISPICTGCDKNYFSYRKEGVTGRFAGIIWIQP